MTLIEQALIILKIPYDRIPMHDNITTGYHLIYPKQYYMSVLNQIFILKHNQPFIGTSKPDDTISFTASKATTRDHKKRKLYGSRCKI